MAPTVEVAMNAAEARHCATKSTAVIRQAGRCESSIRGSYQARYGMGKGGRRLWPPVVP